LENFPIGYNSHNHLHIQRVLDFGDFLLDQSFSKNPDAITGTDKGLAKKLMTFMAIGHDLGMLLNVQNHALYSAEILTYMYPGIEKNDWWKYIEFGIRIHDSSSSNGTTPAAIINYYLYPNQAPYSFEDNEKAIIDNPVFRHAFLAFFISDKLDYGEHRASPGSEVLEFGADPHSQLNSHIVYDGRLPVVLRDRSFILHIPYQPIEGDPMNLETFTNTFDELNSRRLDFANNALRALVGNTYQLTYEISDGYNSRTNRRQTK
jgi:hypothetical protein